MFLQAKAPTFNFVPLVSDFTKILLNYLRKFGLKKFDQIFAKLFVNIFGCEKNCEIFFANVCAKFWVKKICANFCAIICKKFWV